MKIFDCFPFFNEIEILHLRLMELYDAVDHFVIVEANKSHTGKPKPFLFEENKELYKNYLDKIIYVKMEDLPTYTQRGRFTDVDWLPENKQRSKILDGIKDIAHVGDKIIISDLDEIWDKNSIEHYLGIEEPVGMKQQMFYYFTNTLFPLKWNGSVMATYGKFNDPQDLRNIRGSCKHNIERGGWHISYAGPKERIKAKVDNIAEANLMIHRMGSMEKIEQKLATLTDPLDRMTLTVDTSYQPTKIKEFLAIYPDFEYKSNK